MTTSISSGPDEKGRYHYRIDKLNVDDRWVDDAVARAGGYRIGDHHKIPKGVENCDYAFG